MNETTALRRPPALPQLKPHHVSISVPDMEAAIRWYTDILGFEMHSRFEIDAIPAKGAFLRREHFWLELWQVAAGAKVPESRKHPDSDLRFGGTKHVAFLVPDLQSRLLDLTRLGVDIAGVQRDPTEPMKPEDTASSQEARPAFAIFIRDPAGTLIELLDEKTICSMNMS
jgi:methylmalonyl-CoA/ethylmalonyl-CoA epimerase